VRWYFSIPIAHISAWERAPREARVVWKLNRRVNEAIGRFSGTDREVDKSFDRCATEAKEHQIDLRSSWMIGDSETDVEAGRRAGCRTAQLVTNPESANGNADLYARCLVEASRRILKVPVKG
jgi:predicted HAD superfamily phosphohydrolase YqeG